MNGPQVIALKLKCDSFPLVILMQFHPNWKLVMYHKRPEKLREIVKMVITPL